MREMYAKVETKDINYSKVGAVCDSQLEYYITKENLYGIEVIKTNRHENIVTTEIKNILNITNDENKIRRIIDTLVDRKVLPYVAEEIVQDLI